MHKIKQILRVETKKKENVIAKQTAWPSLQNAMQTARSACMHAYAVSQLLAGERAMQGHVREASNSHASPSRAQSKERRYRYGDFPQLCL